MSFSWTGRARGEELGGWGSRSWRRGEKLGGWGSRSWRGRQGLLRVEASVAVDVAARRARSSASASGGEEDVTTGIWHDEGEPGVEAGSEEATCRQRTMKESVKMLQTEEKTKECDSGGELGDMGVVAGGGAESQDKEVRAQRGRRELGEEERRHRRGNVCYITRYPRLGRSHEAQSASLAADHRPFSPSDCSGIWITYVSLELPSVHS